jgi:hypothetical protein
MRALTALVIFMGVLIVAGMAVIVVTLVHRGGASAVTVADLTLAQPAGTHIASIAAAGNRLAVLLQGGGPDRILFIDPDGRVVGQMRVAP